MRSGYDRSAAEQVWLRVKQASAAAQETAAMELRKSGLSCGEDRVESFPALQVPEEALVQWCAWAMAMAESYLSMGRQRRELGQVFHHLAREAQEDARRFLALRYLLYGQRNQVRRGAVEGARHFGAALRSCYGQELNACREFFQAAGRWSAQSELLRTMAARAKRRSDALETVARRMTQNPAN